MQGQKLIVFIDEWEVEEVGKWMKINFWESLNSIIFLFIFWKKSGFIDLIKWEEIQYLSLETQKVISSQTNKQTKSPWCFEYHRFLS